MEVLQQAVADALARNIPHRSFRVSERNINVTGLRCPWCGHDTVTCCSFGPQEVDYENGNTSAHVCLNKECRYGVEESYPLNRQVNFCPYSHGKYVATAAVKEL
jgi:hypothetical protein